MPLMNSIVGIIAPKGSGKTHYACQRISPLGRVAVFDVLHEAAYLSVADDLILGEPQRFAEAVKAPAFRLIYRPWFAEEGFDWFAGAMFLAGNCTAVVEEVDQLCNAYSQHERIRQIVNLGRHRQLSFTYLCRRFAAIHRDLTANTNEFVFFKVIEPRDLAEIASRCGTEISLRVQELRRLQVDGENVAPGEMLIWKDTGEFSVVG